LKLKESLILFSKQQYKMEGGEDMTLMGIMLISFGWIMFVYGMWLYENAYALSDSDEAVHQYIRRQGMETTYYHLGYAIMIEGTICYLLPFFLH
jgi:uncharacterized membrane protein YidH (DUF202 family)